MEASLMGDTDGLLVDDIGFDGSIQWITARCGDLYGPGYHHAVTSAVEGVAGYLKRPPIQHHLTTTGTLLARMSDAIQSLANHASLSGNSSSVASSVATSRSGAAWRGRGFSSRRHVLVLNVTGHAHTDSFKRGFESNLVMSDKDHVPFTDLVKHVGSRLGEARESLLRLQSPTQTSSILPTSSTLPAKLEVVLNISSCFVPSACIETAMELKRLSEKFPDVHVILPRDMVTQPDAIGFNMGFHAKLLDGCSVRDAALYAGRNNHFSVRGIVLFSGGERVDVCPLFPWGSARVDRSFLLGKRKRPREEGREERGNVAKRPLSASTPSTTTPTTTLAEAVLPNHNLDINSTFTTLQLSDLADLETMGFSMVTADEFQENGPRPDPMRLKALVAFRERVGTDAAIYALGPVPVGSPYALLRSVSGAPILPGSWDRNCLFSRSERQKISNLDGLSGQERKRCTRPGTVFQNVLGRTNGCAFCKHGLVTADGLARLYPRIKAHLAVKKQFS